MHGTQIANVSPLRTTFAARCSGCCLDSAPAGPPCRRQGSASAAEGRHLCRFRLEPSATRNPADDKRTVAHPNCCTTSLLSDRCPSSDEFTPHLFWLPLESAATSLLLQDRVCYRAGCSKVCMPIHVLSTSMKTTSGNASGWQGKTPTCKPACCAITPCCRASDIEETPKSPDRTYS